MIALGSIVAVACALAAAVDFRNELNTTNIDKRIQKRINGFLDTNRTLDQREIEVLNRTAHSLDLDKELVAKLMDLVKHTNKTDKLSDHVDSIKQSQSDYNAYEDTNKGNKENFNIAGVEESPDYASSVVLASDLLSLTTAVSKVKDKVCRAQGYKFLDGLLMNKRWALKMFDASAKSPQGLLFGSSYHLGNFDECVGIDEPGSGVTVDGQYCLATIKWPQGEKAKKVRTGRGETLRWAVCVPSGCDAESVEGFVSDVLANTVGNTTHTHVYVTERDCYRRQPISVNSFDVAFLAVVLFFLTILLFSTLYEVYTLKFYKNKKSVVRDLIVSFSVINNIKKILSTRQNKNNLGLECINGIKSLAMVFIVSGHACLFIGSGPVMDADAWDRLVRDPTNAFMLNNALLVDTFLMLSAFLFSRLLLLELDKRRGKLNVIPILIFRYIRLTPAYLVVLVFYMTWLPKTGEGPLWEERMLLEQERCQASWWANILYINNYVNTDKICMFQSWYLSVDTQMFYIAPIFIYCLWRWRKVGPVVLGVAILVSMLIPSIITYRDRLDPTILFYAKEFTDIVANFYFKEVYIKTHMKMTPYFMGLLTGYILHRIQTENYRLSKLMKIFGWISGIVLGTVTVFSVTLFYQEWYHYSTIEAAAYISLHKVAWGIANGWLIIACATGNGGLLAKLLTWKFLVPIARLTYCAYLVNGIVELYYVGQLRHPLHVTFFTVLATAVSHLVLTFVLAMVLCITFESPIHGIEKILLRIFAGPALSDSTRRDESCEASRNTSQSKLET